jgi:hypothetical protein
MSFKVRAAILATTCLLAGCGTGNGISIGGTDYAPEYDYSEFHALTDGRTFRAIIAGNPFPALPQEEMERRLLPVLQASRPESRLTFTYAAPAEEPHPNYRVVLVFDAANDLSAAPVCADQIRHKAHTPGLFDLFAVYCRNDLALSQATARTLAATPEDPRVRALLSQLFLVLFSPFPPRRHPPFPFMRF